MPDERITGSLGERLANIIGSASETGWRVIHAGEESGPFSDARLIDKAAAGEISADDLVRQAGGLWTKAGEVASLKQEFLLSESKRKALDRLGRFDGVWVSKKALVIGGCFLLVLLLVCAAAVWAINRPTKDALVWNDNVGENALKPVAGAPSKDALFYSQRGLACLNQRDYDGAIKDYTEAIRIDPNHAGDFSSRGFAWDAKKNYENAIADYAEAIRLDPNEAFIYRCRGDAWLNQKEYDKAIRDYDEAIRLNPNDANTYNNRGYAWSNKKEHDKAIRDFDEAIRLNPNDALVFNDRGYAWSNKKEYDEAIRDFDEAIRLNPNYALAFNNRGYAWSNKKEYDKAIHDYDEAIRLNPNDALAFNNRVQSVTAKNSIIFSKAQRFVDVNPKIEFLEGDFLSDSKWERVTRPLRAKTTLTRFEHENLLDFLGQAVKHAPYRSDPSFAAIIADLKKWDFTYSGR